MKLGYIYIYLILIIIIKSFKKNTETFISLKDIYTAEQNNQPEISVKKCYTSLNNYINDNSKPQKRCYNLTDKQMEEPKTKCKEDEEMGTNVSFQYILGNGMKKGKYINSFKKRPNATNRFPEIGLANSGTNYPGSFKVHYDGRSNILLNSFPEETQDKINNRLEELKIPVLLPKLKCKNGNISTCDDNNLELDTVKINLYYHDKPFNKFTLGRNNISDDPELKGNYCNPDFIKCNCEDIKSTTCKKEFCDFNVAISKN